MLKTEFEMLNIYSCLGIFYQHRVTLIPAWMSNHMHGKMWDEYAYPFPNFDGCTVDFSELGIDNLFHLTLLIDTCTILQYHSPNWRKRCPLCDQFSAIVSASRQLGKESVLSKALKLLGNVSELLCKHREHQKDRARRLKVGVSRGMVEI